MFSQHARLAGGPLGGVSSWDCPPPQQDRVECVARTSVRLYSGRGDIIDENIEFRRADVYRFEEWEVHRRAEVHCGRIQAMIFHGVHPFCLGKFLDRTRRRDFEGGET